MPLLVMGLTGWVPGRLLAPLEFWPVMGVFGFLCVLVGFVGALT
jgi:hypothetical protein